MTDGPGFAQFLSASDEITRGASTPSTLPVWQRELLFARDTPCVTFDHHEYNDFTNTKYPIMTLDTMHQKSFFFGSTELSAIRRFFPETLKHCSTFDMLSASLWRCRTIALDPNLEDEIRFMFPVNARTMFNPPLLVGYYGNCLATACAISTARDLLHEPLGYAIELVRKAKALVSEEYVRSTIDLMAIRGRRFTSTFAWTFTISNLSRVGLNEVDFGWGKAAYGGPATGGLDFLPGVLSYYMSSTNKKGESGIMVLISLPSGPMEKFVKELNNMLM
ncbi:unnamed protein product [Lactuca virosa]|uniref:Benzyl alcohol O-benzoyltransferase n=1 Tax=Lactuca virosa TaxID=75947 RepID=A0AAU9LSK1_9ASTR|nr:unnamed protein product [Lactuca virosa]